MLYLAKSAIELLHLDRGKASDVFMWPRTRIIFCTLPSKQSGTLLGQARNRMFLQVGSFTLPSDHDFGSYLARLVVQLVVEILLVGRAKEVEPMDVRVNALPSLK